MLNKELIDEFYHMAMYDLAHEVTQQDLYDWLTRGYLNHLETFNNYLEYFNN